MAPVAGIPPKDGNGDSRADKTLDGFPRQLRNDSAGQRGIDAETVANGLDGGDACILLQQQGGNGHQHDGCQRTGQCLEGRQVELAYHHGP